MLPSFLSFGLLTQPGSCFTAGYVVGQIPSSIILASGRITPRFWFPFCVFCWGLCTLGLAFVTSVHQVFAIRFVQALFEASTFSGTHYILGCWYKDSELGKRTAVFTSSAQFGTFFAGIMQGGIRSTLDGRHGKEGWQWMFIINAIMTSQSPARLRVVACGASRCAAASSCNSPLSRWL